jgi:very-short-patch-repair endonuclease
VIDGRIETARLHVLWRGVYSVGRPRLTLRGWWSAAVLACGEDAVLSHLSAGILWGIWGANVGNEGECDRPTSVHVSVPATRTHRLAGIRVHRRRLMPDRHRTTRDRIPVTTPGRTLIDLATLIGSDQLEAAINQADKLGRIDPEALRSEIDRNRGMDGVRSLRRIMDRRTFTLTDSELERRFLRLVRKAGLPQPLTQQRVNGYLVDFYWSELKLVVETDGLRYHRTATHQSRDRERDQAHVVAGLIALRFTHAQVRYDPARVVETLRAVAN